LREWSGISARETDRLLGRAEGHTSLIEAGRSKGIEARTVSAMAELFGVSMDWLFSGTGKAPEMGAVRASVVRAQRRHAASAA